MMESGKTDVTAADLALLIKLSTKPSAQYLAEAGGPPTPKA